MRGIRWLAGALACAFAASAAAQDGAAAEVDALIKSMREKADAHDFTGALEDFEKARVLLSRQIASSFHDVAAVEAKQGDVKKAVDHLKQAASLDPKDFPIDIALWREAVETSRKKGGSKEPDLALIQAEVSAIRGKAFKTDVPADKQSQEDFGAMVDSSIDKEMPKDKRDDAMAGLHRLGLLPEQFDMKKEITGALQSQAAAYYDPKQKKFFNLFSDMPPELVEATAAHELVHALQDQYHDLDKWFVLHDDSKALGVRDDDRTLALRCVVEGEATFVQTIWQMEHMMHMKADQAAAMTRMSLGMVANMETEQLVKLVKAQTNLAPKGSAMAKAMDDMETIQPFVLVPLFAAYMNGASLVGNVDAGGWDAVDNLFDDPPATSEQCLHPEKFTKKRDNPTPIALPEFPEIAAAGWRDADAAAHGELYFRILLKRNGVAAKTANAAAAGWDGDVYRAWRAADGRTAIVLATTWDTPADAQEFFDAYKTALATKYPKLAAEPGDDAKAFRYGCGEEPLGAGALILRGLEVFAVEGFPADLRATMVDRLAAMKVEHVE